MITIWTREKPTQDGWYGSKATIHGSISFSKTEQSCISIRRDQSPWLARTTHIVWMISQANGWARWCCHDDLDYSTAEV